MKENLICIQCNPVQSQYRARTGFSLCSIWKNLFSLQGSQLMKTGFSCWKNYTGKTLFLLQGWVCSVLIVSFSNMSCIVNLSNCCVLVCNFIVFRVYLVTIGPIFVGLSPFQFKLGSFRLNCPRNATICVQVQSSSLKFLNSQLQQQCDKTLQASLL